VSADAMSTKVDIFAAKSAHGAVRACFRIDYQ
jgi:hypothetical protein